jgi:uncharacterized protein (DUF305 family)
VNASVRKGVAAFLFTSVVAGCGAASTSGTVPGGMAAPVPAAAANEADVRFMTGMIHHHAQALTMADLALTHSTSPAIRTLSERIRVSQTDEIALLQQWLGENGAPVPEVTVPGTAPGAVVHHDPSLQMAGMLSPQQILELSAARGAEFDRLFLTLMIQHHEGALDMVETLFASHGGGVDDFIYKIASDTFADQGSEIDRMYAMLDAIPSSDVR